MTKKPAAEEHIATAHALEAKAYAILEGDPLGNALLPEATKRVSKTRIGYVDGLRAVARTVDAERPTEAMALLDEADAAYWQAALRWAPRAHKMAHKEGPKRGLDPDDLAQDLLYGLYRGAQRYEGGHGAKFSTYSQSWMRSAMDRCTNPTDAVYVPVYAQDLAKHVWTHGVEDMTAVERGTAEAAKGARWVTRLDAPVGDDPARTRAHLLEVDSPDLDSEIDTAVAEARLREAMRHLDARSRKVLFLRYGMAEDGRGAADPMGRREIGDRLGVSHQWVRQIQLKAETQLRKLMEQGPPKPRKPPKPPHQPVLKHSPEALATLTGGERSLLADATKAGDRARKVADAAELLLWGTPVEDAIRATGIRPRRAQQLAKALGLTDSPPEIEGKPLWPHQRTAIVAVADGFRSSPRGQIVMASGSGKTIAALEIAARIGAGRILLGFPSLALLTQTLRVWRQSRTFAKCPALAVCSDRTVEIENTTDPSTIRAFVEANPRHLIFTTYQSADKITEGCTRPFDLTILDEAHRCAGRKGSVFSAFLREPFRSHRILSLTATPRTTNGNATLSMDDPTTFGPVFYRFTLPEAIEKGVLADYRVVVVVVEQGVHTARDAVPVALLRCMKKYGLSRVVTFHNRVRDAAAFSARLLSLEMPESEAIKGGLFATHVHGEQSVGERDGVLDLLRRLPDHGAAVVSNARVLGEGVDVPALDGIAFMASRRSEIEVGQALGRVLRRKGDGRMGTVLLPAFVPKGKDPIGVLEESEFEPAWAILRALREFDSDFRVRASLAAREYGRTGEAPDLDGCITIDGGGREVDEAFARSFSIRAVMEGIPSWERRYGELLAFIEDHGHSAADRSHGAFAR